MLRHGQHGLESVIAHRLPGVVRDDRPGGFAAAARVHEIIGVEIFPVQHDLQMEVGPGAVPGTAHRSDYVPAPDLLARADGKAGTVGISGLIALIVLDHHAQAVAARISSGNHFPVVNSRNGCTLGGGDVHAPVQVLGPSGGMDAPAVGAGHIAQPGEVKGVGKRLTVAVGLHIRSIAVRLLPWSEDFSHQVRPPAHGEGGFQHLPLIGVAVLIVFGFGDVRPGELIFLRKQPVQLRRHLFKGEGVVQGGKIGHQFIGVMADLAHAVAVFVIAGEAGGGAVDVELKVGFQLGEVQFGAANFLFVRQIGSGEIGGLGAGQHGGAGGQPRREKGDHQRQQRHDEQGALVRRRVLLYRPGDLSHNGGRLLGVLGGLLGLPCGLDVSTLDFLLLHPPGQGVLPPQLGVVPKGGLPCQLRPVHSQSALCLTCRPVGFRAQAALVPAQKAPRGPFSGKFALVRRLHRHILVLYLPEFPVNLHHSRHFQRVARLGGKGWGNLLGLDLLLKPQTAADLARIGVILLLQTGAALHRQLGLGAFQPPPGLLHLPFRPLILSLLVSGGRLYDGFIAHIRGSGLLILKTQVGPILPCSMVLDGGCALILKVQPPAVLGISLDRRGRVLPEPLGLLPLPPFFTRIVWQRWRGDILCWPRVRGGHILKPQPSPVRLWGRAGGAAIIEVQPPALWLAPGRGSSHVLPEFPALPTLPLLPRLAAVLDWGRDHHRNIVRPPHGGGRLNFIGGTALRGRRGLTALIPFSPCGPRQPLVWGTIWAKRHIRRALADPALLPSGLVLLHQPVPSQLLDPLGLCPVQFPAHSAASGGL